MTGAKSFNGNANMKGTMKFAEPLDTSADSAASHDREGVLVPVNVRIKVAQNIEEMMQVFAVRAAVFLNEQFCPYAEEFDGNDFTATQLLGLIGDEPVAALRIRYFSDFAKIERTAVRREFRKYRVAAKIIDFGFELCRQKGYRKLHGHAEEHLVPFWQKFGFRPRNESTFAFSGHRYVEMECDLEPHPDPLVIGKDPMVFVRPEGAWEERCKLECSGARPGGNRAEDSLEGEAWVGELRDRLKRLG